MKVKLAFIFILTLSLFPLFSTFSSNNQTSCNNIQEIVIPLNIYVTNENTTDPIERYFRAESVKEAQIEVIVQIVISKPQISFMRITINEDSDSLLTREISRAKLRTDIFSLNYIRIEFTGFLFDKILLRKVVIRIYSTYESTFDVANYIVVIMIFFAPFFVEAMRATKYNERRIVILDDNSIAN